MLRQVVAMYPASANAYDSLSEALEASGARDEARDVARRGLEALAKQDLPDDRRKALEDGLRARVQRLS